MKSIALISAIFTMLALTGCGLPTNEMTAEERRSDMEWAFTIFKHNYAPAELKKTHFGVEMSKVEADCVTMAQEEMDNQAFLALFQKCIHSFKDAHVGAQQMNNGLLPEYAQVAHLGFVTMRTKALVEGQTVDALRIVSQLKGSDTPGAPLVPGDLVIAVDGKTVTEHLMSEVVPYINVGQDETSLTQAAFRFAVRTSVDMALPTENQVKLKIVRGPMSFDIAVPWIKEDLLAFQLKQNPPEEQDGEQPKDLDDIEDLDELKDMIDGHFASNPLKETFFGYKQLKNLFDLVDNPVEMVTDRLKMIAMTGYKMAKFNPVLNSLLGGELDKGGAMDMAIRTRILPMSMEVNDLMSEPMFTAKAVTTDNGQTYAYIQLTSFPADDKILTEWFRAITAIEDKGIKSIIIDMIDNGGGSLIHGMRLLNMVRKKPLNFPTMQVRLNNNWVNSFKTQAAFGADDYQKIIAANVLKDLEADKDAGKKISRPIPVTVLDPFFLQNPEYGLSDDVKIAVMVNEMCVSMCDIFASVFQDNNMGVVVGQRTMGGGGNVTQHGLSPITKMGMALTESLMISPKGKYLEDNGVTPDVLVDMVGDRESGFKQAFTKAIQYVMGSTQP